MRVVAVIPAYNEEKRLAATIADIKPYVDDVVVVVDASPDNTLATARAANVHVLHHVINRGQGAALQTGTDYAVDVLKAEIIVHFDADGQMQGSDVPGLLAPIKSGQADVCLGSRFLGLTTGMPLARRLAYTPARLFTFGLTGLWLTDVHNGFRALSAPATRRLRITLDRMAHASEILDLLAASGLKYEEVPVNVRYTPDTLAKSRLHEGSFALRAVRVVVDLLKKRLV